MIMSSFRLKTYFNKQFPNLVPGAFFLALGPAPKPGKTLTLSLWINIRSSSTCSTTQWMNERPPKLLLVPIPPSWKIYFETNGAARTWQGPEQARIQGRWHEWISPPPPPFFWAPFFLYFFISLKYQNNKLDKLQSRQRRSCLIERWTWMEI